MSKLFYINISILYQYFCKLFSLNLDYIDVCMETWAPTLLPISNLALKKVYSDILYSDIGFDDLRSVMCIMLKALYWCWPLLQRF